MLAEIKCARYLAGMLVLDNAEHLETLPKQVPEVVYLQHRHHHWIRYSAGDGESASTRTFAVLLISYLTVTSVDRP
jgi:hypothetical protein